MRSAQQLKEDILKTLFPPTSTLSKDQQQFKTALQTALDRIPMPKDSESQRENLDVIVRFLKLLESVIDRYAHNKAIADRVQKLVPLYREVVAEIIVDHQLLLDSAAVYAQRNKVLEKASDQMTQVRMLKGINVTQRKQN